VRDNGLGVVHDSFRSIRPAIEDAIRRLPELPRNLRAITNRAVFEVPEIHARVITTPRLRVRAHCRRTAPPQAATSIPRAG
jgi:1,2-diacylglycerol 3-beta-galactosyltransferase